MSHATSNCHKKLLSKEVCLLSQTPSKFSLLSSQCNKMNDKENSHYNHQTTSHILVSAKKAFKLANICPLSNNSEQIEVTHKTRGEKLKHYKRTTLKRSGNSLKSKQHCYTRSKQKQENLRIAKKNQTKPLFPLSQKECILTESVKQISVCPKSATATVKSHKEVKELYTFIKNVKSAEKCLEFGIVQDFNDDVAYLMESLNQSCNFKIRCLSLLNLSTKCMSEDFQRYLHETNIISLILSYLDDPHCNNNIALCLAIFLCSLSQDTRNKNDSIVIQNLLIELLQGGKATQYSPNLINNNGIGIYTVNMLPEKLKDKAVVICKQLFQYKETSFDIDSINIATVSFKALMNIYEHATQEIKEDLYNRKALHFIVEKVHENIKSPSFRKIICLTEDINLYEKLKEINQCLQILENACYLNLDNQQLVFQYKNCIAPMDWNRLLKFCLNELFYEPSQIQPARHYSEKSAFSRKEALYHYVICLISTLKVFVNITHKNLNAIEKIGSIVGLIENLLICILQVSYLTSNNQFEILVLALELIINLIDQCWINRKKFAVLCLKKYYSNEEQLLAIEALIKILLERLDIVAMLETFKDDESQKEQENMQKENKRFETSDDVKEVRDCPTNVALKQADKHMEHSIICTYISVLLGYLAGTKNVFVQLIKGNLSSQKINDAVLVADKFLTFIVLTEGISKKGITSLNHVLKVFKSIYQPSS